MSFGGKPRTYSLQIGDSQNKADSIEDVRLAGTILDVNSESVTIADMHETIERLTRPVL